MVTPHQRIDSIIEREQGLQRNLSSGQLSMIAIGGAIGTGLFLGSGLAIGLAGPSVLVSYAIGALVALLLMGSLAEMTVMHPTSGSFGAYAEYYVGPLAGFLVRYAYWTSIVLAIGTEVTAIAGYMQYWWPTVPGWCWIISVSLILICINSVSVNIFGAVEYSLSLLKIIAIVGFILLGGYLVFGASPGSGVGFSNYVSRGGFLPNGWWGMWVAVFVAIFSYFSIEMIAVAAGEARDPRKAITQAFRVTMVRLVVFYLLTLALILAIVPWTDASSAGKSPFVTVMAATHVPGAAGIFNFVILVAALSAMNSQLYSATRMMFSLSRAGFAPRQFGRLTSRGVPGKALLASATGTALATGIYLLYPQNAFVLMISIASFGAIFTWIMIFVTHIFFRRHHRDDESLAHHTRRVPWTSFLGAGLLVATLVTSYFTQEFKMTVVCGVPFLIVLCVVFMIFFRERTPATAAISTS